MLNARACIRINRRNGVIDGEARLLQATGDEPGDLEVVFDQ
jgi:hypothetical protein